MMNDGYIRVATANIHTTLGSCTKNKETIINKINELQSQHPDIILFNELSLTGSSLDDLFYQEFLLEKAKQQFLDLVNQTKDIPSIIGIGFPLRHGFTLHNVYALILKGEIIVIQAKSQTTRHFQPLLEDTYIDLGEYTEIPFVKQAIIQNYNDPTQRMGIVIGEDLENDPACIQELSLNHASLILHPQATYHLSGIDHYRDSSYIALSRLHHVAIASSNAGDGESTSQAVYDGYQIIVEDGKILKKQESFEYGDCIVDVDVDFIQKKQHKAKKAAIATLPIVEYEMNIHHDEILREYSRFPFISKNESERAKEIFMTQALGLKQRMIASYSKTAIIGISGGLDSTLAILVAVKAFDLAGMDRKNIYAITMPCFGTTKRTKNNALGLAKELGVSIQTVNIGKAVMQHFKDINHDPNDHSVTYENAQARERTQVLMDIANKLNGMVVGTGDLSEVALGWATYNGDHMSMYGVNADVSKTLIRSMVTWYANEVASKNAAKYLLDILDTPVSPELLPTDPNETNQQKTEDIVGPYELHDFFIYHMTSMGYTPKKLYRMACHTFNGIYSKEVIKKWIVVFYRRFLTQQFKRSCSPDGPKVGSISLSIHGDLFLPSDGNIQDWMDEVNQL